MRADSDAPSPARPSDPAPVRPPLRDLVRLFLWLGFTAFGGPAAHIALMDDAVVRQRGWLPRERFLQLLGVTNLLPGPNSTEMAMHIGQVHRGGAGLVLAGVAFILPAALMSSALAWGYARYGLTAPVEGLLYGLKPVVVAVVAQALWRLAGSALRTAPLVIVFLLALAASVMRLHELGVLLAAGLLHLLLRRAWDGRGKGPSHAASIGGAAGAAGATRLLTAPTLTASVGAGVGTGAAGAVTAATATGAALAVVASPSLVAIFLVFLKIGSVLFGSGYVLLLFLRTDLVERLHWLTEAQLLDAIAVGQIVPGPVTTTVTFIGYLLAGPLGALVSTVGVFLPAFCVVALSARVMPLVERSAALQATLDGVVAGSLALMALVLFELGRAALIDLPTALIAIVTLVALVRYRANPAWCVAGAAAVGLALRLVLR